MESQAPPPSNKPYRDKGKGDTARRGDYKKDSKNENVLATKHKRSRIRTDSSTGEWGENIIAKQSRSGINIKKFGKIAWEKFKLLQQLDPTIPEPDRLKTTALFMGEEHGLLATDAARVLKEVLASTRFPATVSVHMFRRWFREAGMNLPIRSEVKRLHKKKGMTAVEIYQNFQSRKGDVPYKKTPLTAIKMWIALLKQKGD